MNSTLNEFTGLYEGSNGGTEKMYRELIERLPKNYLNEYQIICSRFRKKELGKKQILWLHDLAQDPEVNNLANSAWRSQFHKLIFVSDWQWNSYNQLLGVPYNNSFVLKNAIEPIEVDFNEKFSDDKIRLIYHTTPHRGLEILVPIFVEIVKLEKYKNLHLDVFSSFKAYGWEQRDIPYEGLFKICREHPNITYHGYVDNSIVKKYLKKSHIFAYPSIWQETSCIAAIEAMSAGNIVVCPDYGALKETVDDGGYVYRWNENINIHANVFARTLMYAVDNISQNSHEKLNYNKQKVDYKFGWDLRIKEWVEVLRV